jgi:Bacterial transglutaminase-like cysteine proteinase BTLCP
MRQLLRRFLAALTALVDGVDPPDSPWDRVAMRVPTTAFGSGSRQQFAHYFDGTSCVPVTSIDDIVTWLLGCEYTTDMDLFNERDRWQHPSAFEQMRRGDCEDFALWAWRKLSEISIDAEFYVGRVCCGGDPDVDRQHAWVVYRFNGTDFLFEPAARSRTLMIRPLVDAMDDYVPHFAVDRRFRTCAFVGCVLDSYRARQIPHDRTPA